MEHVWVRAYVPYTDYRGAGNAGGESLWIDLDTSIKAYESVENIYDTLDEQGFSEAVETITKGGDATQIESLLNQWEEKLQSEDLSETYARKRVIKKGEVSYLPLSLQYTVEKESRTFAQVEISDKDSVSFEVNGNVLADFAASDLQRKSIWNPPLNFYTNLYTENNQFIQLLHRTTEKNTKPFENLSFLLPYLTTQNKGIWQIMKIL